MNSLHTALAGRYWLAAPLLLFVLYLLTMPGQVTFEDDGLFLMTGYFAGIGHPPGYPLYSLAGAFTAIIPIGSVPLRLHALSALCGALTCLMVAWIVRRLLASDLLAFIAALAYGCSAVFWSQSIIAEVYTPNALLIFLLIALALPAAEPLHAAQEPAVATRYTWLGSKEIPLPGVIVLVYGLSLTLHWPLVALSTPALCLLLWPQRQRYTANYLRLLLLFFLGLSPYLWMVMRSHSEVLINFYGPIQSAYDFWYLLARQGYIGVDVSATAGPVDMIRYAGFLAGEIISQYSVPGFVIVLWGFIAQWHLLTRRLVAAFTLLFLCHSAVFLLLIHFDYDDLSRAAFGVYPLIAYGVMAIWFALGLHDAGRRIIERLRLPKLGPALTACAGGLIVALLLTQNLQSNNRRDFSAARDYARAVLENLPPDTELFVSGDIATFVLGYMHHVEGLRPDVTLYSLDGIVFSNRLFHPHRTQAALRLEIFNRHVQLTLRPVCTTEGFAATVAQADSWLYTCIDRDGAPGAYRVALNDALIGHYGQVVAQRDHPDAWTRFHQERLRKRAGYLKGRATVQGSSSESVAATAGLSMLADDFHFVLGYLDGLISHSAAPGPVHGLVETVNRIGRLPAGAKKKDIGRFLALRGRISEYAGDPDRARTEYEGSLEAWPDAGNEAADDLLRIYAARQDGAGYERIRKRFRPSLKPYNQTS